MKRLLITGASGFLGWNICIHAGPDREVFGTYLTHPAEIPGTSMIQADLTRYKDLKRLFGSVRPEAVIHAAAASKPDFCQKNRKESHRINTDASINIAGLCADMKIPCIFTSSDLVFDGRTPPYSEADAPSPVNIYAEQKVLAESGMKKRYPDTTICRMALMFGASGSDAQSFLYHLIADMQSGKKLSLFMDEFRTPLSARDAVQGLMIALRKRPGTLHLGGGERISRLEFGQRVKTIFGIKDAVIDPCSQKALDLPAPRPPDLTFDISKAKSLGFKPHRLAEELKRLAQEGSTRPRHPSPNPDNASRRKVWKSQ
jgi:dTDP-4-dehydrorhamnose reductase